MLDGTWRLIIGAVLLLHGLGHGGAIGAALGASETRHRCRRMDRGDTMAAVLVNVAVLVAIVFLDWPPVSIATP